MSDSPTELSFDVEGLTIQALAWGDPNGIPVLALHGWLDNANSFSRLAPLLSACHVVALDLPGQGRSDHYPPSGSYNLWDDLSLLLGVMDCLGWKKGVVMGHSRGAMISMLLAASCPERVSKLIMLDGIWPAPIPIEETAEQLGKHLKLRRASLNKSPSRFSSLADAASAKSRAARLSMEAAELIVERGTRYEEGGYYWSHDPKLQGASAMKMSRQHNRAMVAAVKSPALLLLAEEGYVPASTYEKELQRFPNIEYKILPGGHHFHLEEGCESLLPDIERFLFS